MPDASFDRLETARLILRRFRASDLDSFVAYRADPSVARYQSWENFTREDGMRFIEEMMAQDPDKAGEWFQIAIELKATGEMIGDCAVHALADAPSEAEIGFTIAPQFQGLGYATEAVTGLLAYLFGPLGKRRVIAITDVRNAASVRVLRRLRFVRDDHPREPTRFKGELCEEHLYVLTRDIWRDKSRVLASA
jgi:RimJ/RimL family protein N-acetyltransferase